MSTTKRLALVIVTGLAAVLALAPGAHGLIEEGTGSDATIAQSFTWSNGHVMGMTEHPQLAAALDDAARDFWRAKGRTYGACPSTPQNCIWHADASRNSVLAGSNVGQPVTLFDHSTWNINAWSQAGIRKLCKIKVHEAGHSTGIAGHGGQYSIMSRYIGNSGMPTECLRF